MNLLSTLCFLLLGHFSSATIDLNDYLGSWDFVVTAPDITYNGVLNLEEKDGTLTGRMDSEGNSYEMKDVKLEENVLTFKLNVDGYLCDVKGKFEDDVFTGEVSVEGYILVMTAKRKDKF